jgi:F-type H+-transporting ATPase subunit a
MELVKTSVRGHLGWNFFTFFLAFMAFASVQAGELGRDTVSGLGEHPEHHAGSTTEHGDENFTSGKMKDMILHHISDAHEWHFFDIGGKHITLPLPVILYSREHGLDVFLSSCFRPVSDHGPAFYKHYKLDHGHISLVDAEGNELMADGKAVRPLDFSITKNVFSMLIACLIMLLLFVSVAGAYKGNHGKAPRGLQSFMEPLILFVRDDIARPNMGNKAEKFTPYLLTLFFFIWINNLLGLLPGAANVTGNIAVTLVLALLTLILTNINGNKHYWGHILWPPGIPLPVKFILIPVEIISIFTKPFSLMIRLFANITAGHILIMSIISLIFLFGNAGKEVGMGFGTSVISVAFSMFLYTLELLVAAIQAFIFTMLTALFIGQAVEDHHAAPHGNDH